MKPERREWTETRAEVQRLMDEQRLDARLTGTDPAREAEIVARAFRAGFGRCAKVMEREETKC